MHSEVRPLERANRSEMQRWYSNMERGLTLLSECFGLLFTSCVVLLGVLHLSSFSHGQRARNAAQQVEAFARSAMALALQSGCAVVVSGKPHRLLAETESRCSQRNVSTLSLLAPLSLSFRNESVRFFPSGVQTPTAFQITLKEHRCVVILSLRGRVRTHCESMAL